MGEEQPPEIRWLFWIAHALILVGVAGIVYILFHQLCCSPV